uniref:CAB/ELIP/HLIP superfamily protein n=1 Tax=Betaphycus gelatinus TaxID=1191690 RepID=A0A8E7UEG1_9FLOR|nr:CAB/ELIP/HLIP superfamily protein [Betaphycus gelatinus]
MILFFINLLFSNKWIWGFSEEAESWNGRLAMIAFCIIIIIELMYSCSILGILGILKE